MEFFQDDIFPDTKVTWEPSLTAKEWLGGSDTQQKSLSLKPEGMTPCETISYVHCVTGGNASRVLYAACGIHVRLYVMCCRGSLLRCRYQAN